MTKQRRPPEREAARDGQRAERVEPAVDPAVAQQQVVGNLEATRGVLDRAADTADRALAPSPVTDLAGRVALALRVAPRDAADVERLVGLVERSGLSGERREAIVARLQGDLDLASRVSEAVRQALGRDDPAERSALVGALERVAGPLASSSSLLERQLPSTGPASGPLASSSSSSLLERQLPSTGPASGPGDDRAPEVVVAEAVARATGHGAPEVEGLCRALSGWIAALWWEEEEEEAPPGDYAAEESGT